MDPKYRNISKPSSERDKFALAKWLLLGIVVLFVIGGVEVLLVDETGENLDMFFTILLPILFQLLRGKSK